MEAPAACPNVVLSIYCQKQPRTKREQITLKPISQLLLSKQSPAAPQKTRS